MGVGTAWLGRPDYRTLAALTSSLGAKWGANVDRHQATSGHVQPRKPQVNATQGHVRPHPATGGVCMACKRSGVRIPIAPPQFKSIIRKPEPTVPGARTAAKYSSRRSENHRTPVRIWCPCGCRAAARPVAARARDNRRVCLTRQNAAPLLAARAEVPARWPAVKKEHSSASSSRRILPRMVPRASWASARGARCPAASALSMSRPETPWMAGDHGRQFQVAGLQQFPRPLLLAGAGLGEVTAVAGAGAEPADRLGRHEAGGDHAPLGDPGEPDRVGPVFSELTPLCRNTTDISTSRTVRRR